MDLARLKELIRIFEASELSEMEVEEEGRRVRLSKAAPAPEAAIAPVLPAHVEHRSPGALAYPGTAAAPVHPPAKEDNGLTTIDSPMVGVFYAGPAPGEPPFASPGDTVKEDQTVCIVEAMKLMNEVTAKFDAEIVSVLVENGEPVEFGQGLFKVRRL